MHKHSMLTMTCFLNHKLFEEVKLRLLERYNVNNLIQCTEVFSIILLHSACLSTYKTVSSWVSRHFEMIPDTVNLGINMVTER